MLYDRSDKMARLTFCREYGIDEDTEARARERNWPWPPHIKIGCRVVYSRQRTAEWFEAQETASPS